MKIKTLLILLCVLVAGIVIGGLVSSTLLTLIVIPTLYEWLNAEKQLFETV